MPYFGKLYNSENHNISSKEASFFENEHSDLYFNFLIVHNFCQSRAYKKCSNCHPSACTHTRSFSPLVDGRVNNAADFSRH